MRVGKIKVLRAGTLFGYFTYLKHISWIISQDFWDLFPKSYS